MPEPIDPSALSKLQRQLIELERQAEIDEARRAWEELPEAELERRGVTLRRLVVADTNVGFGGRVLVVLEASRGAELPAHRFAPGDVVAIRAARERGSGEGTGESSGVVTALRRGSVTVALDEDGEETDLPSLIRLDRVAPDVTFRRMRDALRALESDRNDEARPLRDVLLHRREPEHGDRPTVDTIAWFDADLDASQREAVAFALAARHVALIHGPPGTGKTTAVVEVVRQSVARGESVLATAPSNVAVDNLVERLARAGLDVVRIGHPARLLPAVRAHALDARVEEVEDKRVTRALRREIEQLQRSISRSLRRSERRDLRSEQRALRRELRAVQDGTVRMVVDRADVVLCTTTGAADRALGERRFDLVVVDEAAQVIEPACWIPLHRARRALLAGDHRQLPPTVVSIEAERQGLSNTLFERLAEGLGESATRMLTVQYRMHETIMRWSSMAMYDGRLAAAPGVATHLLADLAGVESTRDTTAAFVLLDTAGCGLEESADQHDGSKANPGEAGVVVRHVENLMAAGVPAAAIGVITPYNAQVQLLRAALAGRDELEIGTVDGFQGREKEAVVLSLVRSNDDGEVGFLSDSRRLNVAVTRARRHVAIVGDSATLASDRFLAGLVEYANAHGEHRTAWELL